MRGRGKGSQFERDLCRQLSLWWTNGSRDDVFWRSAQSGGRATFRAKKGKQTFGSYGDIAATDPIGRPLLDLMTIEAKKGYGKKGTAFDALDNLPRFGKVKPCQWEEFVIQASTDSLKAGTPYWMLVHRRPQRATMCFVPYELQRYLKILRESSPAAVIGVDGREGCWNSQLILAVPFESFLASVKPDDIRELARKFGKRPVIRVKRIV